ncbi:MAG: hypothetical protein R2728_00745 [Chitinophagales bacterium]
MAILTGICTDCPDIKTTIVIRVDRSNLRPITLQRILLLCKTLVGDACNVPRYHRPNFKGITVHRWRRCEFADHRKFD